MHKKSLNRILILIVILLCWAVTRGIFASRPRDVIGLGVVYGHFSNDLQNFQRRVQQLDPSVGVQLHGHIELAEAALNPPKDRPSVIRLHRDGEVQRLEVEACNQHRIQGDHFAEAILNDTPVPFPLEDAVANMEVIDAIVASGRTGSWVQPGGASPGSVGVVVTSRQTSSDDFPLRTEASTP